MYCQPNKNPIAIEGDKTIAIAVGAFASMGIYSPPYLMKIDSTVETNNTLKINPA